MNKNTYKAIAETADALRLLDLTDAPTPTNATPFKTIVKIQKLIERRDHAQADWDERTERWQESEVGEEERERLNALDTAINSIEMAYDELQNALQVLEEIEQNAPEGSFR